MLKKLSIRIKLILFSIIVLSVFMTITTYITIHFFKGEVSNILQSETAEKIEFLNLYLEDYLATPIALVEKTADQVKPFTSEEEKKKLLENLKIKAEGVQGVIGLHVAFQGDKQLYSSEQLTYDANYDSNQRDWYIQSMKKPDEIVVTDPYIDAFTGKLIVGVSKTLPNNEGVVTLDLDLAFLEDIVSDIKIGKAGYAFVVDNNGQVLYHPSYKQSDSIKQTPFYDEFMKNETIEITDDGEHEYLNHYHNDLMNWEIGSSYTKKEVETSYKPIVLKVIILNTIAILIMASIFYLIISKLLKPLNRVVNTANKVAEGNLTETIEVLSEDEIGKLSLSFNNMTGGLKTMIYQVDETAGKLNEFSQEVSASIEENVQSIAQVVLNIQTVTDETREQVQSAQNVKQTVHQMDEEISNIASNIIEVQSASESAESKTTTGVDVMQHVLNQMNLIEGNAKLTAENFNTLISVANEISNFSKVISGIADQTNLLALNASIEAARAGEHGKGFAVVAEEVRKLAEQTSESANEIHSLINAIHKTGAVANESIEANNKAVHEGMDQINHASEVFNAIHDVMKLLADKVTTTQAAIQSLQARKEEAVVSTDEIVLATQRVSTNVEQVAATTEEQNASMEQMAVSAQNLSQQAQELRQSIKKFEI